MIGKRILNSPTQWIIKLSIIELQIYTATGYFNHIMSFTSYMAISEGQYTGAAFTWVSSSKPVPKNNLDIDYINFLKLLPGSKCKESYYSHRLFLPHFMNIQRK